jgi:DNA-binding NarL/FixJ family response regulator
MAVITNQARAMKRPRVLLADDHQMVADALKSVLEPRCEVVGTVKNGNALLEAALTMQPDVIVLEVAMPEMNGLTAARHLKQSVPKAKLVFLTMNEDPQLVGEAFRAGASAFLLKQSAAFELTEAIERVLKGGSYLTPRAERGQTNIFIRGPQARHKTAEPTLRQREVIRLMAEGCSMKEAADLLKITTRTVASHKYAAMELLQLKTNADLVQYALRNRIISM